MIRPISLRVLGVVQYSTVYICHYQDNLDEYQISQSSLPAFRGVRMKVISLKKVS